MVVCMCVFECKCIHICLSITYLHTHSQLLISYVINKKILLFIYGNHFQMNNKH